MNTNLTEQELKVIRATATSDVAMTRVGLARVSGLTRLQMGRALGGLERKGILKPTDTFDSQQRPVIGYIYEENETAQCVYETYVAPLANDKE